MKTGTVQELALDDMTLPWVQHSYFMGEQVSSVIYGWTQVGNILIEIEIHGYRNAATPADSISLQRHFQRLC